MRILHQNARRFALDSPNTPRSVAEQHDLAGHALDRKVLVDGSNNPAIGLGNNREERIIRDRPAARNCRQPCSPARAQLAIDSVVMQICAVAPTLCRDTLRQHVDNRIESCTRKIAIGIGALD